MRKGLLLLAGVGLLSSSLVAVAAQAGAGAQAAPSAAPAEKKEVKVAEKVLKTYVGVYELDAERHLTITLEEGQLHGQPSGQEKRPLFAESQTSFFLKTAPISVTFQKDAKGAVTGLLLKQGDRPDRELKKVK